MYKSVGPCLDISSGSFAFGRGPVDIGVVELRNQFSRVIFIILHPVLFILFYFYRVFFVGVSDINKEHLLIKRFLQERIIIFLELSELSQKLV